MATSMNYWKIASTVQEELKALAVTGDDMYGSLESNDDPDEVAVYLADIQDRLVSLSGRIGPNISALRKVAKALNDLPGMKAS